MDWCVHEVGMSGNLWRKISIAWVTADLLTRNHISVHCILRYVVVLLSFITLLLALFRLVLRECHRAKMVIPSLKPVIVTLAVIVLLYNNIFLVKVLK